MNSEKDCAMKSPGKGEERYRLLLDTLTHGVQENDCDGVITYSNRAHHQILGYEFGELVGKQIWDVQPSTAEQESLRNYFVNLVKEQPPPAPFQTKSMRKDGALVDLQIDWNYTRDANGVLNGFISVITDITERKKAEESLRQQAHGLATLLEASQNLAETLGMQHILQATVDGVTKLVGLDTAAVYLLEDEVLHLWATTPPLPPQFPETLRVARLADHPHIGKAISSGSAVFVSDITAVDLTQDERSIVEQRDLRTVLYVPLIADEKAMGAFIVGSTQKPSHLTEIELNLSSTLANLAALAVRNAQLFQDGQNYATQLEATLADRLRAEEETKSLQAQLLQAQKMETFGRLAGGIAHDFNNILVPIIGYAELAMMDLASDDKLYSHLERIHEAAERAADLTHQILAFSRKQVLEMRVLDLNAVVANFKTMVQSLIGEDIDFETFPSPDLCRIKADHGQLEQVLMNLVVNARDAMPRGGKLTIETANIYLDEAYVQKYADTPSPGHYVMLAVSDTGHGMNTETQQQIFEPFFTTKEPGEGTGLGLATVFGIVKQHGGNIWVYSELNKGTTFKIYLPQIPDREHAVEIPQTEPESLSGTETILVVEDEAMVRKLVCETLAAYGYKIIEAQNGHDGLQRVSEYKEAIHLLLTDVIMPEMDGRELYQNVVATQPAIKVLYMSGYTDDVIVHHGILEEGINFLQKPFTVHGLMQKVRQVLS